MKRTAVPEMRTIASEMTPQCKRIADSRQTGNKLGYFLFARQNEAARAADASREVVERWLPSG